jgi:hypothetical protein
MWSALGRRSALALIFVGSLLIAESILSHVVDVGWSGAYVWQRILAIVVGGVAVIAGGVRLWRSWSGWPTAAERAAFRRRWRPFFIATAVYFTAFTIMGPAPGGDQPHYELEAFSLAYFHTRDMAVAYNDPNFTPVMFPAGVQGYQAYYYKPHGEFVSGHNVGLPLLLTPAVPLVEEVGILSWNRRLWPWGIEMILFAALAAQLLYHMLERVRPRQPGIVAAVWAAVVFSPPMTVYASQVYPEMPATLLALAAVNGFFGPPSRRRLVGAAVAASLMPWLHVRFLPITVLLVLALALRAVLDLSAPQRLRVAGVGRAAWPIAPLIVSTVVMGIAFQHWYGSPLPNAQYRLPQTRGTLSLSASWTALAGGFWSSQDGWLPFAPVCILALACVGYSVRRYRVWALFGLAVAAAYLLEVTIEGANIGFSFPGRYELVLMPFSAFPLLIGAADLSRVRWLFWPLATITLLLTLAVVFEPPTTVAGVPGFTGIGYPQLLWPWFVHIWPQIVASAAHLYPDAVPAIAWSAVVLAASVGGYFAVPRRRSRGAAHGAS